MTRASVETNENSIVTSQWKYCETHCDVICCMFTKHVYVVVGSYVGDHGKQNKLSYLAKHRVSRGLDEPLPFVLFGTKWFNLLILKLVS